MKFKVNLLLPIGLVLVLLYFYLFYFVQRWESLQLISVYILIFLGYLLLIQQKSKFQLRHLIWLAIILRLIPIASTPALSDDFYRFIWDGLVWSNGINPFYLTPKALLETDLINANDYLLSIYELLNSQETYTVYPAIPQYINIIAVKLFPGNLIGTITIMRFFILLMEIGSIYFLIQLLGLYKQDLKLVIIYALNPLVIIELSGNLHHEGLMIMFFLGFFYYLKKQRTSLSAGFMAFSVASKLLPLMFLPFILFRTKNPIRFSLILLICLALLFFPLLDQSFLFGMKSSLELYYQKFEFNAGLYYLAREIGYWYYGYNAIGLIGKAFFILASIGIALITLGGILRKINEPNVLTFLYLLFLLFSLIIHPWYILMLMALAPLSKLRFSLSWSFLIFLSYLGYSQTGFIENYWVVVIEYLGLVIALFYDWKNYALSRATLKDAP